MPAGDDDAAYEAAERRHAAFQRELARYELQGLDSKLSFIAAALIGAEEIARTLDLDDGRELPRGINAVMHEALRLRRGVREQLRAFDDKVGREWGVGRVPEDRQAAARTQEGERE